MSCAEEAFTPNSGGDDDDPPIIIGGGGGGGAGNPGGGGNSGGGGSGGSGGGSGQTRCLFCMKYEIKTERKPYTAKVILVIQIATPMCCGIKLKISFRRIWSCRLIA